MIPDYDIEVWRNVGGVCTQIDNIATTYVDLPTQYTTPTEIHNFLLSELIRIKATQTVSGQVSEAEVVFDNDPNKKFQAGDIILIWLGFEATGRTNKKIFSGVVYEAAKESTDEDKTITLRARDWSFLLLTDKFTASYPISENAKEIVIDILGNYVTLTEFTPPFQADYADGYTFKSGSDYDDCHIAPSADTVDFGSSTLKIGQKKVLINSIDSLYVDSFSNIINEGWTLINLSPYLNYDHEDDDILKGKILKNVQCFVLPPILTVASWTNIHNEWTHVGDEPWLNGWMDPEPDLNYICLPAINPTGPYGDYDEYYSFQQITADRADVGSINLTVRAAQKDGTGGRCSQFIIMVYFSFNGGLFLTSDQFTFYTIPSEENDYHDITVPVTDYFVSDGPGGHVLDISKFNSTRMRIALANVTDGGVDKGEIRVTYVHFDIDGTGMTGYSGDLDEISTWTFSNVPSGISNEVVNSAVFNIRGKFVDLGNFNSLTIKVYLKCSDTGWTDFGSLTFDSPAYTTKSINVSSLLNSAARIDSCEMKLALSGYDMGLAPTEAELHIIKAWLSTDITFDNYNIWRGYLYFDTSILSDDAVIDSAYVTLYPTDKVITQDFDLRIQEGTDPAYPEKPPIFATYNYTHYTGNLGEIDGALIVIGSHFNIPVDKDNINKTGITKLTLRTTTEIAGTAPPTGMEGTVTIASFDHGTPAYHPVLHVFVYSGSADLCEYKIGVSNTLIEDTIRTRQLDFDGEPLIDAMTKVSDATEHDWYVDEEKMARWFTRRDLTGAHTQDRDPGTPLVLMREDLTDYNVTDPEELLCNKVKVYGRNNKSIPWNLDIWTEDPIDPTTNPWLGLEGCSVSRVASSGEEIPKAGNYMIKISNPTSGWFSWDQSAGFGATCLRPLGCTGYYVVPFGCPSGAGVYFKKAGGAHSGDGSMAVQYAFDTSEPAMDSYAWITIGSSWSGGYQDRCVPPLPGTCPGTPQLGITNMNLYIRWKLSLGWTNTGQMYDFHVEYQYSGSYEKLKARFTLPIGDFPNGLDLDPKESPKKLVFVIGSNVDDSISSTGMPQVNVLFKFTDGTSATYRAQYIGIKQNEWSTVEIPIGPDASENGWTGVPIGKVEYIEFEYILNKAAEGTDYILIDWLHFDEARWYGEDEDSTSETDNGVRFKEIFDDTLYSDTAAGRRAVEFIKKFKDPIVTIKDVEVDYVGMENLDPGKVLIISNTIPEFALLSVDDRTYRIETIEHHLEENDYYVKLILSLDPIYFEGNVYQISERVRRMEQRGNRKPAAESVEVD